jgi:hypothetical protein
MSLLKLITTFVLIYLAFRFVTMYLFPALLRWYIHQFKKKFYEQNPHLRPQQETRKKGVNIRDERSPEAGKITDKIGEYIDFEEIKDDKKNGNK